MAERPAPVILITRPADQARPLQRALEARGYGTLIEPLLAIEPLGPMAALDADLQAIALTSANAVPALSSEAKRLPIFAVGGASAEAAKAAGGARVIAGGGDAADLAELIARSCRPEDGAILHLAGEIVREELHRRLRARGFEVRREVVYRAVASEAFSDALIDAWRQRTLAAVLLFSPRTAEILVRLLIEHGLSGQVDRTVAICVSERAAAPCRELAWRDICLAPQPNRDALIRTLEGSIRIC